MNYQALIFDLDDTLIDFGKGMENCLGKLHAQFFFTHPVKEYKEVFKKINDALWELVDKEKIRPQDVKIERFRQLVEHLSLDLDYALIAEVYEEMLGQQAHWFPGVKETLIHFKKTHKIGVITNGFGSVQKKKYQLMGIEKICSSFIISEHAGVAKPNKVIFDMALKELDVGPSHALMVGDRLESDYQGALNAGLDFCWVNPQKKPLPAQFPEPKYIVSSVADLKTFFLF